MYKCVGKAIYANDGVVCENVDDEQFDSFYNIANRQHDSPWESEWKPNVCGEERKS